MHHLHQPDFQPKSPDEISLSFFRSPWLLRARGRLETWVNGTAVPGLTFVPGTTTKTSGVNDQWKAPSPFQPTSIGFGWTVFSGENLTIWFDDIAVGSTRIGCN